LADVRQGMIIWLTNAQTYLNGIPTEKNMETALDPAKCKVGRSLSTLLSAQPSIQSLKEYEYVNDLHIRQHNLVKQAVLMMESSDAKSIDVLKEKDKVLDEFVEVTDSLDQALADLDKSIIATYGAY